MYKQLTSALSVGEVSYGAIFEIEPVYLWLSKLVQKSARVCTVYTTLEM